REESRIKKMLRIDHEWMTRGVEARRTKQKYRIERFKEMSKIKFEETKSFEFSSVNTYLGKKIINIKNASKSYGDKEIFSSFSLSLLRSDHIGLVGDNGCGKTTLFKIIMGEEKLTSGEIELGETLKIGYFSQHFDCENESLRVIDYILKESNEIETLDGKISAKSLLERFLFDGKLQYSQIKTLSGGQKRRLQLVKVLSSNPNILLLDEPTNDLDIYTMEILEQYLSSFIGPIICISHDRFFLDKVCDSILYYDNKRIITYNGSFSEFLDEQNKKEIQEKQEIKKNEINKEKKNIFSFKDQYELSLLEKEIPELEKKIEILNSLLEEESEYSKMEEISSSLNKLNEEYEKKTIRYMELLEKKEQ
ncbi:MAG: ATP-binding cassette domain-containing protein, partial [Bacilli bacterium]